MVKPPFMSVLTALVVWLATSPAFGFGAAGHHAICEISYRELTPKVRVKVDQILHADEDERFFSFAAACGWPDRHDIFGPIIRMYGPDHYINVPRQAAAVRKCYDITGETDRCLLTSIPKMIRALQGRDVGKLGQREAGYPLDKTEALRFLGHWLGDIHQPLHVSYVDDRGGNEIAVFGLSGCSEPDRRDIDGDGDTEEQVTRLHTVWDTCIVHDSMAERGFGTGLDDRGAYSDALYAGISGADRKRWSGVLGRADWAAAIATETYTLVRDPLVQYCVVVGSTCQYAPDAITHRRGEMPRIIQVTGAYSDLHRATVEEQMKKAGIRLGALLNQILK